MQVATWYKVFTLKAWPIFLIAVLLGVGIHLGFAAPGAQPISHEDEKWVEETVEEGIKKDRKEGQVYSKKMDRREKFLKELRKLYPRVRPEN